MRIDVSDWNSRDWEEYREFIAKCEQDFARKKQKENKKIRVGDAVKIIDGGDCYHTNIDFFKNHNLLEYGLFYRYGVIPRNGMKATVVAIEEGMAVVRGENDVCYGNGNYSLNCYNGLYLSPLTNLEKTKGGLNELS